MESLNDVAIVLRQRGRQDLSHLLLGASVEFREEWEGFTSHNVYHSVATAIISAPLSAYDCLKGLPSEDSQQLLNTVQEIWPVRADGTELTLHQIEFRLDRNSLRRTSTSSDADELLQQLEHVKSTLITVSTDGPRINDVNAEYKESHSRLTRALDLWGLQNPIPYRDLWNWHGKWSDGSLPNYRSRREYIQSMCEPLETLLHDAFRTHREEIFSDPTGWDRVDRAVVEIRNRLASASTEEQFQAVGLLCRETLTSVAQTVFDPDQHPTIDGVEASTTDAKRMLDGYFAAVVGGRANEVIRRYAKTSVDLANELQHKRTAEFRDAALCAQATSSIINIIAIISGVRDPQ